MKTMSEVDSEFKGELKRYMAKSLGILAMAILAANGAVALTGAGVLWSPALMGVDLPLKYWLSKDTLRKTQSITSQLRQQNSHT